MKVSLMASHNATKRKSGGILTGARATLAASRWPDIRGVSFPPLFKDRDRDKVSKSQPVPP